MIPHLQGQRCKTCKGVLRWVHGSRPSHVFLQDVTEEVTPANGGLTHQAVLESGDPEHTWEQGRDGAPDVKMPYAKTD